MKKFSGNITSRKLFISSKCTGKIEIVSTSIFQAYLVFFSFSSYRMSWSFTVSSVRVVVIHVTMQCCHCVVFVHSIAMTVTTRRHPSQRCRLLALFAKWRKYVLQVLQPAKLRGMWIVCQRRHSRSFLIIEPWIDVFNENIDIYSVLAGFRAKYLKSVTLYWWLFRSS